MKGCTLGEVKRSITVTHPKLFVQVCSNTTTSTTQELLVSVTKYYQTVHKRAVRQQQKLVKLSVSLETLPESKLYTEM